MATCYNCGCEIPNDDKTRLCDKCKKIMLPFVKFMDVSTSSAVHRLVSNERNLRSIGVTDSGMEYLYKICELQDKKRMAEKSDKENAAQSDKATEPLAREIPIELEPPKDEPPLNLLLKRYGEYLTAAAVILYASAAAMLVTTVVGIAAQGSFDISSLISSAAFAAAGYVAGVVRKIAHDLDEIKKRFR